MLRAAAELAVYGVRIHHRRVPGLLYACGVWLVAFVPITGHSPQGRQSTPITQRQGSDRTYQARRATTAIAIDGHADETAWAHAAMERHFTFPWTHARAQTEFRALWDDSYFYFTFRVQDADVVVLDRFRDEQDAVLEDRAPRARERARRRAQGARQLDPPPS